MVCCLFDLLFAHAVYSYIFIYKGQRSGVSMCTGCKALRGEVVIVGWTQSTELNHSSVLWWRMQVHNSTAVLTLCVHDPHSRLRPLVVNPWTTSAPYHCGTITHHTHTQHTHCWWKSLAKYEMKSVFSRAFCHMILSVIINDTQWTTPLVTLVLPAARMQNPDRSLESLCRQHGDAQRSLIPPADATVIPERFPFLWDKTQVSLRVAEEVQKWDKWEGKKMPKWLWIVNWSLHATFPMMQHAAINYTE